MDSQHKFATRARRLEQSAGQEAGGPARSYSAKLRGASTPTGLPGTITGDSPVRRSLIDKSSPAAIFCVVRGPRHPREDVGYSTGSRILAKTAGDSYSMEAARSTRPPPTACWRACRRLKPLSLAYRTGAYCSACHRWSTNRFW